MYQAADAAVFSNHRGRPQRVSFASWVVGLQQRDSEGILLPKRQFFADSPVSDGRTCCPRLGGHCRVREAGRRRVVEVFVAAAAEFAKCASRQELGLGGGAVTKSMMSRDCV